MCRIHARYVFSHSSHGSAVPLEEKLLREIEKQFHGDGESTEGSSNYHFFVLESLLELFLHAEAISPAFASRLEVRLPLARFAVDLLSEDGWWPVLGDADGGFGTGLFQTGNPNCRRVLGMALNQWFRMEQGFSPPVFYPGLGLGICRSPDADSPAVLTFLAGPAREQFGVHMSHHHADRLSITLRQGSSTVFTDPGTHCYNEHLEGRFAQHPMRIPFFLSGVDHLDVGTLRFGVGSFPKRLHCTPDFRDSDWPVRRQSN